MKVGLMLPTMVSIELNEMALQGAEALGMDSVWLPDHMLGPCHPQLWPEVAASAAVADSDSFLDPFCVAAILRRQTSLTMGTCVTDSTRRRGADLARAALTLQRSGQGEFVLGLGSGEAESLLPFGYDFTRPFGLLEQAL
jgi:phthiodiolone/phenolphthiodiolone dimycocerosates ketoreductase